MAPPPPSSRTRSSTTPSRIARLGPALFYCVFQLAVFGSVASKIDGGWDTAPNTQYHVQTDEGPERYFKYQTISGQYRKERRLQDGTVVGTYGWVDADGYLRLNDYVADSKGYRIVKNKKLYVGTQTPVGQAVSEAKYAAPAAVIAGTAAVDAVTTPAPAVHSSWRGSPFVYPSDSQSAPLLFPSSTAAPQSRRPPASRYRGAPAQGRHQPAYRPVRPADVNSIAAADDGGGDGSAYRRQSAPSSTPAPEPLRPHTFRPAYRKVVDDGAPAGYDGVSFVRNGFRYYLPRHYHEERTDGDGSRTGSFGYVDPFGIRRVVYYDSAPGAGFAHRKNNRYVGLDAEPYDPRPMSA